MEDNHETKDTCKKVDKTIALLLIAGLVYAVYFTELGKPVSPMENQQIALYDQTAIPTLFVKWSQVPTVKLDWAYADQRLLKFSLNIYNLPANSVPEDWICIPQIKIDNPVPRRLTGYAMTPFYDSTGEAFQAVYEYEIDARDCVALAIDMNLVIGPCTNYGNFQETNVTPEVVPELVGVYHLNFQVPVIESMPSLSLTPTYTAVTVWRDVPIFPGGIESNDYPSDYPIYNYIVENVGFDLLQEFYKDQMKAAGWELFSEDHKNKTSNREFAEFYFSKPNTVADIQILERNTNSYHIYIRAYDDPVFEE